MTTNDLALMALLFTLAAGLLGIAFSLRDERSRHGSHESALILTRHSHG